MQELWLLLRRNIGLIAITLVICIGLAVAYALRAIPIYEASTTVRIDQQQSNIPVLDVLKDLSTGSELGTEVEVLRSRSLAEVVVDSLALRLTVTEPRRVTRSTLFSILKLPSEGSEGTYRLTRTPAGQFVLRDVKADAVRGVVSPGVPFRIGEATLALAEGAAREHQIEFAIVSRARALRRFASVLAVTRPSRDANVVVVSYQSTDPVLAREVPNVLAYRFITRRNVIKKSQAHSTVDFLRRQLDTLNNQLVQSEDSLRDFRERARVVSLGDEATAQVQRLAQLQADRTTLDGERTALAKLVADVQNEAATAAPGQPSPYRRLLAFPSLLKSQSATAIYQALTTVEGERADLLVRRKPQDPDVMVLSAHIHELEGQINDLATTYLEGLTNQVASIDGELAAFSKELEQVPAKEVQFARLQRRPKVLEDIFAMLQSRLKESEIAEAVDDPSVRVVDEAITPDVPVKPNKPLVVGVGGLLGMLLGLGLAFFREGMDRTLHTRDDLARIAGVHVLALIPRIKGAAAEAKSVAAPSTFRRLARALGGTPTTAIKRLPTAVEGQFLGARLVTGIDPRNPVSEAYRSLRTNVTFARPEQPPKSLVFTSPLPGDGKSTTAANLAVTLAQQGTRVLLVDADMRRGVLNTVFGVSRDPGLSNVIFGGIDLATAVRPIQVGEGGRLDFLPTGTLPPNPAELLGSAKMRDLLTRLGTEYDVVILDAPPVNVVTDAAVLATVADGLILVTRAGVTTDGDLRYAMVQINNVRAPILGTVLNDVDFKRDMAYGGSYEKYQSYYGVEEDAAVSGSSW